MWPSRRRLYSVMSASRCNSPSDPHRGNPAYRKALWAVLAINAAMFAVEIGAGLAAGSASLQADALDFLGDAANYGISLFVVGMASAIGLAFLGSDRIVQTLAMQWIEESVNVVGQACFLLAAVLLWRADESFHPAAAVLPSESAVDA